jgi:hypothetical protein
MSLKIRTKNSRRLYCCLCTEKFDSVKGDYQCPKCLRFICNNCIDDLKKVNLYQCPYCTAVIEMINLGKANLKSLSSLRTLILFYYKNKNWELVRFFSKKLLKINPNDTEVKNIYIEADYMIRSYY